MSLSTKARNQGTLTETNEAGRYAKVKIVIVLRVLLSRRPSFDKDNMIPLSSFASCAMRAFRLLLSCNVSSDRVDMTFCI
jgi:hypothetical protein